MLGRRNWTDDELVLEIKRGNKQALLQLYRDNFSAVRNHILKNNGKEEDAEDILQDAVVVVWQKVSHPEFELTSKLSTFLFAVAKNLWLKALNKNKRMEPMQDQLDYKVSSEFSHVEAADLNWVVHYMDRLGDTCKQLLQMFYFEERNMQEIAQSLNFANADTAKAKKYQCFKRLESMVKERFQKSDFLG
ncbi:MAG: sigma-70 family RNA polymerase sigma factor [Bacteroidetes bacterium]|nr:MAG: sigma-70 family RNA polymerase sigma factor [Bacteroidota bacterium]